MIVIAKPAGRGNWHQLAMAIEGTRAQPLLVKPGDKFNLAGVTWRVVSVHP